ncbi:MAG TPA: ATP-binding protein, partial [Candidatus Lokiarchaeia archaeon]
YDNLFDAINGIDPDEHDINLFSLKALQNRIIPFEKYTFLKDRRENKREDSLENIFSKLTEGKSIVIDFGTFGTNKHLYYFIANSITRRLYKMYSEKEEESDLPPLVIVVEEAHKFLKPSVINYTIFDRIAREMRKFQLTLAFVDQRPSQIDDEVFSQIANRFIMNLTDEKDIDKVVKNLPNSKNWRGVIVGLLKQQFFMYGDAIAVPSIIEVMDYNNEKLLKTKLGLEKTLAETINEIENTDVTKIFSDKEEDK